MSLNYERGIPVSEIDLVLTDAGMGIPEAMEIVRQRLLREPDAWRKWPSGMARAAARMGAISPGELALIVLLDSIDQTLTCVLRAIPLEKVFGKPTPSGKGQKS